MQPVQATCGGRRGSCRPTLPGEAAPLRALRGRVHHEPGLEVFLRQMQSQSGCEEDSIAYLFDLSNEATGRRRIKQNRACLSLPFYGILLGMRKKNHFEQIEEHRAQCRMRPGEYCRRCLYYWIPRTSEPIDGAGYNGYRKTGTPKRCPSCKSKYWASQRTNRQGMRPEA